MTAFTPAFRRTVDLISKDVHLVPLLETIIGDCDFPEAFTVTFRNYTAHRAPDGWFHPSSHPTKGERELYYYLTEPESWTEEPFPYGARMSVMMGAAMHDLIEVALIRLGVLLEPTGTCVCCGKPHGREAGQCSEWGVRDDVLRRRGHIDGLLQLGGWGDGVYDLKTATPEVLRNVDHNDLELFKRKWPKYYGQAQDYMAMTGRQKAMIVFLGMSGGWQLREFTIPRDEAYIVALEAKYRSVLAHVEQGRTPLVPCCPGGAKARKCPAVLCPVKAGR